MTIKELREAQTQDIKIYWEWNGLDMVGKIDGFVDPDQIIIKWAIMEKQEMRFQEYLSIIPACLFEWSDEKIKINE